MANGGGHAANLAISTFVYGEFEPAIRYRFARTHRGVARPQIRGVDKVCQGWTGGTVLERDALAQFLQLLGDPRSRDMLFKAQLRVAVKSTAKCRQMRMKVLKVSRVNAVRHNLLLPLEMNVTALLIIIDRLIKYYFFFCKSSSNHS